MDDDDEKRKLGRREHIRGFMKGWRKDDVDRLFAALDKSELLTKSAPITPPNSDKKYVTARLSW